MSIRIKIQEVNIEEVRNGRNKYDKAEVVHTANGQSRTQKIMSFSNPAVFNVVKNMKPGEEYDITVTKNDAGFNQWAKVDRASNDDSAGAPVGSTKSVPARTNVSTYETAQERAIKQLYIVRQSSIANAISYHKEDTATVEDILATAQQFVDFVFNQPSKEFGQESQDLLDMGNDI
jgi:hypothetical protein